MGGLRQGYYVHGLAGTYPPTGGFLGALQQAQQGGFAGAVYTHNAYSFAGGKAPGYLAQHLVFTAAGGRVADADVFQVNNALA